MIVIISIVLGGVVVSMFSFALGLGVGVRTGIDTERRRLDDYPLAY